MNSPPAIPNMTMFIAFPLLIVSTVFALGILIAFIVVLSRSTRGRQFLKIVGAGLGVSLVVTVLAGIVLFRNRIVAEKSHQFAVRMEMEEARSRYQGAFEKTTAQLEAPHIHPGPRPLPEPVAQLPDDHADHPGEIPVLDSDDDTADAPAKPLEVVEYSFGDEGEVIRTDKSEQLPEWVSEDYRNKPHSSGHNEFVLSSQRFPSAEEARQQLLPELKSRIRDHFAAHDPLLARADLPLPLEGLLGPTAIPQEAVVTWPLEVGGNQLKVYQVHWKVQLTDLLAARIWTGSREYLVNSRLKGLGLGLAALTGAFGLGALIGRRRTGNA